MRSRTRSSTLGLLLSARETVAGETPASLAMCLTDDMACDLSYVKQSVQLFHNVNASPPRVKQMLQNSRKSQAIEARDRSGPVTRHRRQPGQSGHPCFFTAMPPDGAGERVAFFFALAAGAPLTSLDAIDARTLAVHVDRGSSVLERDDLVGIQVDQLRRGFAERHDQPRCLGVVIEHEQQSFISLG
jgi:hypothetical protein